MKPGDSFFNEGKNVLISVTVYYTVIMAAVMSAYWIVANIKLEYSYTSPMKNKKLDALKISSNSFLQMKLRVTIDLWYFLGGSSTFFLNLQLLLETFPVCSTLN